VFLIRFPEMVDWETVMSPEFAIPAPRPNVTILAETVESETLAEPVLLIRAANSSVISGNGAIDNGGLTAIVDAAAAGRRTIIYVTLRLVT